jgi:hypothetical protein
MANELKDLIAYLADKINYEVGEDDSVSMKRPGGGGQEGIFYYSPNLKPWILAQRALKLLNTPDHSEAIAALERVRSNICDHGARFIDQGFGIGCWVVPKSAVINEIDRELAQLRGGKEAK